MFYQSLAGIRFNVCLLLLIFVIVSGLILIRHRDFVLCPPRSFLPRIKAAERTPRDLFATFLFILIVLQAADIFVETFFIYEDLWDSWANWAFKAKVYFVDGIIPFAKYKSLLKAWGCWDYPHHVPLMETWVFLFLGHWNDQVSRLIFPVFWTGLAVCSYAFYRRYVGRSLALAGVFIMSAFPVLQVVTIGTIGEPVLLFYYMLSVFFLLRWCEESDPRDYILSAILIGVAAWTKVEGGVYFLFSFLVVVFSLIKDKRRLRKKIFLVLLYAFIFFAIAGPWWIIRTVWGLENLHFNSGNLIFSVGVINVRDVCSYFGVLGQCMGQFYFLWPMTLLSVFVNGRTGTKSQRYAVLMILCHLGMITMLACINPGAILYSVNMERLLLAPSLLSLMYVMMALRKPVI